GADPSLPRGAPSEGGVASQDDGRAREAVRHRLHGNDAATEVGIMDHQSPPPPPSGEHDEMIRIPVEDAADGSGLEVPGGEADADGLQAKTAGCADDCPAGHTVPPGPGRGSQL